MTTNFNDIPQEKFDNLESKIVTPKDIKNLKINYIDIQDFKNIESVSTELGDWNIIGWFNANGKSSFVEAILTAIQSNKFYGKGSVSPASLVRKWENEAVINLLVKWENEELIIKRVFKKWTLKKPAGDTTLEATLNGEKISQASLDELLNNLTIDPLKLSNLTIQEQIKEIKNTIWLDTTEIDQKIKDQEEATRETRKYNEQAQAIYDDFISAGKPENVEKKSLSELLEKRKIFEKKAQKLTEYNNKKSVIEWLEAEIERLQNILKKEQGLLEQIKLDGKAINQEITYNWLTTVDELDAQINEIEAYNKKADRYQEYLNKKEYVLKAEKDFKIDKDKLDELRSQRTQIIANSHIPEYMEISDELGILVDGIEYKLLNTARKIEVAIDLILISGSPLRMIRIENWWELDTKTLEKVKQKVLENNFCIFIERPVIDKFDTIIINDGEIIEDKETFINNQ